METSRVSQQFWRVVFSVWVLALGGCWVGRVSVSLPERLPSKDLPTLAGPISFDLCLAPTAPPPTEVQTFWRDPSSDDNRVVPVPVRAPEWERQRQEVGGRIQTILSEAGVPAELTPVAGSSVVFTVTLGGKNPFDSWSTLLSLFTFSLVPGYSVGSETLDVDLAEPGAEQGPKQEHLQYESRERFFFWAPLIVYPDLFASTSGGWQSSKMDDADKNLFPRLVQRLADDIRVRLGAAGAGASGSRVGTVACPKNLR